MQRHQQKQHVFLIILVLLHTMVCFNLKFTYNFALLINMMLLMKKGILGCNIIYLFILICIGIALPIKSQNNYKVKLTGTVYEYDHNNKRLPLEFAAVSIPEIALGTTSDENGRYILENVPTGKIRMQIQYLGKVLPSAVFGLLVIYSLKDVSLLSGSHGIPEAISILTVLLLHLWKRQMLFSIAGGTICYMALVQLVF